MTTIPYTFEKLEEGYLGHLQIEESDELTTVKWKLVDLPLCHKGESFYPSLKSIAEHTPAFKDHSLYGFSLGAYSEFFIYVDWGQKVQNVTFFLGDIEISLGEITPLAQYIYDGNEVKHYHPPVSELKSIRISAPTSENIESILLYAILKLRNHYEFVFDVFTFYLKDEDVDEEECTEEDVSEIEKFKAPISDIEPLRLVYKGIIESETANAFLHFYRVLEFYSALTYQNDISAMRSDHNISSKEFVSKILQIFNKDERSMICKLVSKIADAAMIKFALSENLIKSKDITVFSNALYDFRNSLVHAKYDQKINIYTESLFENNPSIEAWKKVCEDLAIRSIETFGTRLA